MIINAILGNIFNGEEWRGYSPDYLELEWYELNKRIMRKTTTNMLDARINLTRENASFSDGDILGVKHNMIVVVKVKPCECIEIIPKNYLELARVCYEVGNRHAPIFIDELDSTVLLLAMDNPLLQMLKKMGVEVRSVMARLVKSLSSGADSLVAHPHHH